MDVVFLDDDVADAGPVARFRGRPPERHQVLQFRTGWGHGSVSEFQPSLPHGKIRTNVNQLFIEGMDNILGCSRGNFWRWSVLSERRGGEQKKSRQQPIITPVTVEGPHAAPRA